MEWILFPGREEEGRNSASPKEAAKVVKGGR